MTVGELKRVLESFPEEMEIVVDFDINLYSANIEKVREVTWKKVFNPINESYEDRSTKVVTIEAGSRSNYSF